MTPPVPADVLEASALCILVPATLHFSRVAASLRLTRKDDQSWWNISVVRTFPLTHRNRWLSIRDTAGTEIGVLPDISGLTAEDRRLVEVELDRRYVMPVITRVRSIRDRFGIVEWTVDTTRGPACFNTRDIRDHLVRPTPHHYILTDLEENRFEIPDLTALDHTSQAFLLRYV